MVEDDPKMVRLLRLALEPEGWTVVVAADLAAARRVDLAAVDAVVLDRNLPDGDGTELLDELDAAAPHATVVVHSTIDDERRPAEVPFVDKGDVFTLLELLGARDASGDPQLEIAGMLRADAGALAADWAELCRWDPMLPPDSRPAIAPAVIDAIVSAIGRPQPLGWGPDPEVEQVVEAFAMSAPSIDEAIEQLVCLRDAATRRLGDRVPAEEAAESWSRLHMLIDRCIGIAAQRHTERLREEALTDPLTRLPNRRALDRQLRRECARGARYDRRFTVVVIDLDGLKAVNDRHGHPAGDAHLRRLADALGRHLRAGDTAFRIGGDEFAVLLPETTADQAASLLDRPRGGGAPPFSWGAATFPDDATDPERLLAAADDRLLAQRAARTVDLRESGTPHRRA